MTNPIVFKDYTLTKEEAELLLKTLKEIRAEKARQQTYKANKDFLYDYAVAMIDAIGVENTKQIFREITRKLREIPTED